MFAEGAIMSLKISIYDLARVCVQLDGATWNISSGQKGTILLENYFYWICDLRKAATRSNFIAARLIKIINNFDEFE